MRIITLPNDRKYFITSDHHFYHENIIKYSNRPFSSWQEMNYVMMSLWNEVVGKNDIVFHLGDVFCGCGPAGVSTNEAISEVWENLNGKKLLIKGNHDDRLNNKIKMLTEKCDEENIEDGVIVHYDNFEILLCHRPMYKRNVDMMIHGHTHEKLIKSDFAFNASVDVNAFAPIELIDVVETFVPF